MIDGSRSVSRDKALRGLTTSELQTLETIHAHQLGILEGVRLGELNEDQRANFKVLLVKRLVEFELAAEGTFRCIPTRMGRGVLLTWEIKKLFEQPSAPDEQTR